MNEDDMISALRKLLGTDKAEINWGDVVSVNEKAETCTVEIDELEHEDVMLSIGAGGSVEVPEKGSRVLIGFIEHTENAFVVKAEKLAKVLIRIGDSTLEGTPNGWQINGGKLGGMVKLEELVAKLNALEQDINGLKQVLAVWAPVPTDGGTALKTASATWAAQPIAPTQKADLENKKVTQ